jgi:hypothetical protein
VLYFLPLKHIYISTQMHFPKCATYLFKILKNNCM